MSIKKTIWEVINLVVQRARKRTRIVQKRNQTYKKTIGITSNCHYIDKGEFQS